MQSDKILVIGANGQLGSVLSLELQKFHGKKNVILSDINANKKSNNNFEIIVVSVTCGHHDQVHTAIPGVSCWCQACLAV